MSQTNMQTYQMLMIFVMLIGLAASRPNGSVDSQVCTNVYFKQRAYLPSLTMYSIVTELFSI